MNINPAEIMSDIIVYSKYARYLPSLKRRETWEEVVTRNATMHATKFPELADEIYKVYADYVLTRKVVPSMRSLQFAGDAILRNPMRMYNCSTINADVTNVFNEAMFNLLSGTGVGISVQKHQVAKLPPLKGPNRSRTRRYLIADDIEGWSDAIKVLMESYFFGKMELKFDYSAIREKGTDLVTSGGKAPGPAPLRECIDIIKEKLDGILEVRGEGTQLKAIEVFDIICHESNAVLAGGIRRSALITLFSHDDEEMLTAKSNFEVTVYREFSKIDDHTFKGIVEYNGLRKELFLSTYDFEAFQKTGTLPWYLFEEQRGRSNNSVALKRGEVTKEQFMAIWEKVEASGAGEPGVYWTNNLDWGTNPCVEISMPGSGGLCNLTELNASNIESQEDFEGRARAAAFIGTLQASYSDFHYVRDIWKQNVEEERLLGVSMTGIGSGKILDMDIKAGARAAVEENRRVAKLIDISPANRVTTIKPSGTSSLVLECSSGIHAWFNDFYERRVRVNKDEPLYKYLKEKGFEAPILEDDCFNPHSTGVFAVPFKAPENAILRHESPMELLERVKKVKQEWIDEGHIKGDNTHNVSVTVSIKDGEWEQVGEWMWENRAHYNGISVLNYDGGTYPQMPFEDITEEQYVDMCKHFEDTKIDLTEVIEEHNLVAHGQESACAGGNCEISAV